MPLTYTRDGVTLQGIKSLDNQRHTFDQGEWLVVAYFEGSPELWAVSIGAGLVTLRQHYNKEWPDHVVNFDIFLPLLQGLTGR